MISLFPHQNPKSFFRSAICFPLNNKWTSCEITKEYPIHVYLKHISGSLTVLLNWLPPMRSAAVKGYSVKNCVEKKPSFFNILPCKALPKLSANQIELIFLLENCHPWSTIVYCKNEFSLKLWIMNRKPTSNTWNVFTINTVITSFDEDPELSNQYLT